MAFNWRKTFYPVASDLFAPHTHMQALAESATTIIPVTGHTERDALSSHASADNPVYVDCSDATHATPRLEVNRGAGWAPVAPTGLSVYAQRGAQSATQSSNAWFLDAVTVQLPATAPPGRYAIDGQLVLYIDSATETAVDRRVMWGSTEIEPASSGNGVLAKAGGGDAVRSLNVSAVHTMGGAVTVHLDAKVTLGSWAVRAATELRVTYLGLA